MEPPPKARPLGLELPMGTGPAASLKRIEMLEFVLERSFRIPGLRRQVGLDAILGLVPVAGDLMAGLLGSYIIWEARNLGLPKRKLLRMAAHIVLDTLVGSVPVAGDLFDVFYRSNTRNLRIVKRHVERHHPELRVIEG